MRPVLARRCIDRPIVLVLIALVAVPPRLAAAQGAAPDSAFTLEDVLSAPFPTDLVAAPAGGRVAWVSDASGRRNIWIAEPTAAGTYHSRALTTYTGDDGVEITDLVWRPDGQGLIYHRGGASNPGDLALGAAPEGLWAIDVSGTGAPRTFGEGHEATISPAGDRVAYIGHGGITIAPVTGAGPTEVVVHDRGSDRSLVWSPDGARLAFVSDRGDHSLIGVYNRGTKALGWLSAGVDHDANPIWSPDGRFVAFLRLPTGSPGPFSSARTGEPWSIRVADASTGRDHELWRASAGVGSLFHELDGGDGFGWGADDRVVFPWERNGWVHLYSIDAHGGSAPVPLMSGRFDVFSAALTPDRREVVYSSNQGDTDRRHLWRVGVTGGTPTAATSGTGIEDAPVVTSDGAVAFLRSDARLPMRPAILTRGSSPTDLDPDLIPATFPATKLVVPQAVIFHSADGVEIHGQLFLPPNSASGQRHPALVFFHGGPYRQMLLGWHPMDAYTYMYGMNQYFASRGYVVLSVNYRGGTGYGLDFRVPPRFGPSGASEFADVLGGAHYLASRPDVDPKRLGVWGGSYGGYLTALALARASDIFAAGVDYAGVTDWSPVLGVYAAAGSLGASAALARASSPIASMVQWRSPVLVIQADDDHNVPFAQTVQLVQALREHHVPFQLIVIPNEIHDLLRFQSWLTYFHAQSDFLDAHLQRTSVSERGR